jgi:methylated-DNA-protein-cysteine methyltransferase related protein
MKTKKDTYKLIWQTVKQIPKGKVATYGQVAEMSGFKGQARLVGYALHNLPKNTKVPWFRVINSKGEISFPKKSKAFKTQKMLIDKERVMFNNNKIDLTKYGWLNNFDKGWKPK